MSRILALQTWSLSDRSRVPSFCQWIPRYGKPGGFARVFQQHQWGTQYIRVTVTEDGPSTKVTWENESFECALTGNVCEGSATENGNAKAGKVKITVTGAEIKGEGSDLEGAFTFT